VYRSEQLTRRHRKPRTRKKVVIQMCREDTLGISQPSAFRAALRHADESN
jgi:hypothetical protein